MSMEELRGCFVFIGAGLVLWVIIIGLWLLIRELTGVIVTTEVLL